MARVLVICGDHTVIETIRGVLEAHGHAVLAASDGSDGFGLAVTHRPDLVLLGLALPVLDGYSVLGALRTRIETCMVPVAAMLPFPLNDADERRCTALGVRTLLPLPIEADMLIDAVGRLVPGIGAPG